MVSHPTTSQPAHGLSTAEQTGNPSFHALWSIAKRMSWQMLISHYQEGEEGSVCFLAEPAGFNRVHERRAERAERTEGSKGEGGREGGGL